MTEKKETKKIETDRKAENGRFVGDWKDVEIDKKK